MTGLAAYPLIAKILKPKDPDNTDGDPMEDYETYIEEAPVWQENMRERELWEARALFGETVAKFRMRFASDKAIEQGMIIEVDDRQFRIAAPPDNKYLRNKEIILTCKEVE